MRTPIIPGVVLSCLATALPAAAQATFQPLGTTQLLVQDLDPGGEWIAGQRGFGLPDQSYLRWNSQLGVERLDLQPAIGRASVAAGGSPVLVTTRNPLGTVERAALWTPQGVRVLGGLGPGGSGDSHATAISKDGSVAVGYAYTPSGEMHAVRWSAGGGVIDLDPLTGAEHFAGDVSLDGQVIVGTWDNRPALWQQGSWQELVPANGSASAVDADGSVVAGFAGQKIFRWTRAAGPKTLPRLSTSGQFGASVRGLDGSGDTAIGYEIAIGPSGHTGWVWRRGAGTIEVTHLLSVLGAPSLSGWDIDTVDGISEDGLTLAGNGRNPNGSPEGWIATLPPVSTSYCTAKVSSQGCLTAISSDGTPSASSGSGFRLDATQLVDGTSGLLFYSTVGPASTPLQGGYLCVQPPLLRAPVQSTGGSGACTGMLSLDFNAYLAGGTDPALVGGAKVWAQYWSRDPASPSGTNLTDAIEFVLWP